MYVDLGVMSLGVYCLLLFEWGHMKQEQWLWKSRSRMKKNEWKGKKKKSLRWKRLSLNVGTRVTERVWALEEHCTWSGRSCRRPLNHVSGSGKPLSIISVCPNLLPFLNGICRPSPATIPIFSDFILNGTWLSHSN